MCWELEESVVLGSRRQLCDLHFEVGFDVDGIIDAWSVQVERDRIPQQ